MVANLNALSFGSAASRMGNMPVGIPVALARVPALNCMMWWDIDGDWLCCNLDMVSSCVGQNSTLEYQKQFWVGSNLHLYNTYHVREQNTSGTKHQLSPQNMRVLILLPPPTEHMWICTCLRSLFTCRWSWRGAISSPSPGGEKICIWGRVGVLPVYHTLQLW